MLSLSDHLRRLRCFLAVIMHGLLKAGAGLGGGLDMVLQT